MKVYVLVHEPYHENSHICGVYTDYELAMSALQDEPKQWPEPTWDDSDTLDLQEWDIELGRITRMWQNRNPHSDKPVLKEGDSRPRFVKLGWRVEEVECGASRA